MEVKCSGEGGIEYFSKVKAHRKGDFWINALMNWGKEQSKQKRQQEQQELQPWGVSIPGMSKEQPGDKRPVWLEHSEQGDEGQRGNWRARLHRVL